VSDMKYLGIVLLYVMGILLVLAEALLPGAVLGIIGLGCVLAAVWLAFGLSAGLGWTLIIITVALIPFMIWLWLLIFKRAMMMRATGKGSSAMVELKELMGKEGVALTQLRPAGMARIEGKKVDVVSEGAVIEKGTRVKVIEVEANRVVVRDVNV